MFQDSPPTYHRRSDARKHRACDNSPPTVSKSWRKQSQMKRHRRNATMKVSTLKPAMLLLGALAMASPATAETWPTHNITAIIPFAAGNANDITARIVLEQVGRQLGQAIIIDNRGGAGGTIGVGQGARAT